LTLRSPNCDPCSLEALNAQLPSHNRLVARSAGMSAAGRRAIAEMDRGESPVGHTQGGKETKRKLSAAGRAAIVAALKKR
jgi:hypothetical protein